MKQRRTAEQMIKDLEAQIAHIKSRSERRKAKADPAVRLTLTAARTLDKALAEAHDSVLRKTVEEARIALAACLATHGITMPQVGAARPRRLWQRTSRVEAAVGKAV